MYMMYITSHKMYMMHIMSTVFIHHVSCSPQDLPRPTPTAAAVQRTEAGARRPGHLGPNNTPNLPTRLPHISAGEQEFEEREAGEVGGSKRVKGRPYKGIAAVEA